VEVRAGSVFTGIGGSDRAFDLAGFESAWQIENAKFPRRVLEARWPDVKRYNDVSRVNAAELTDVDVLHGGFPCQDVSVAGRRAGLAGERSGLFHEFIRLAATLRPRWIVIENVPGLLSSNDGGDMGTILGTLADLGYGWAYRVLDAQHFGLAQRRERVFIVGYLGDGARALEVLFEPESGSGDTAAGRRAGADVAFALASHSGGGRQDPTTDTYLTATLNSGGNNGGFRIEPGEHLVVASVLAAGGKGAGRRQEDDTNIITTDLSQPLDTDPLSQVVLVQDGDGVSEHAIAYARTNPHSITEAPTYHETDKSTSLGMSFFGQQDEPVRSASALALVMSMGVRKLTPLECERLQGFDDGWTCLCDAQGVTASCTCPDSPRYRALGNAIAVPVMRWIAERIMLVERSES
jgi:DNA (cytosine-5)-methyltransferase 1